MEYGRWQTIRASAVRRTAAVSVSAKITRRYWTQKFGVTAADLRDAIKKVGNSAKAVEAELDK
jgi:hypothetical protein